MLRMSNARSITITRSGDAKEQHKSTHTHTHIHKDACAHERRQDTGTATEPHTHDTTVRRMETQLTRSRGRTRQRDHFWCEVDTRQAMLFRCAPENEFYDLRANTHTHTRTPNTGEIIGEWRASARRACAR